MRISTLATVTAALVLAAPARAQSEEALVKTESGCSVFVNAAMQSVMTKDRHSTVAYTWTGDCVEGLAQGAGTLRTVWRLGDPGQQSTSITTETMKVHRGKRFGFVRNQSSFRTGMTDPGWAGLNSDTETWTLIDGDRGVMLGGLGLEPDMSLLRHDPGQLPQRTNALRPMAGLSAPPRGGITLMEMTCAAERERFPECGFEEGKQNYKIYYFMQSTGRGISGVTKVFCPQPRVMQSCASIAPTLVEPYVTDALAAISALLPKVRETEVAMTAMVSNVARRQAESAEQAAREKAAAAAAFDSSLERAAVGELFAIADESKSKGDTQSARQALRKLMSRFPDHKLAPIAAGMLTEMQGK